MVKKAFSIGALIMAKMDIDDLSRLVNFDVFSLVYFPFL